MSTITPYIHFVASCVRWLVQAVLLIVFYRVIYQGNVLEEFTQGGGDYIRNVSVAVDHFLTVDGDFQADLTEEDVRTLQVSCM